MNAFDRNDSDQITTSLLSNGQRLTHDSQGRFIEPESKISPHAVKARNVNRAMLATWSSVAFSHPAFLFRGLLLGAKCHGD